MTQWPVAWITHAECQMHEVDADHPESPRRLQALEAHLRATGLADVMLQVEAPAATVAALARVHDGVYIERILRVDASAGLVRLDADTAMNAHTRDAALRAAGAGVRGVDLVLDGQAGLAFCAVRPPGHHAERSRAMGFCLFNNVAVAAAHARAHGVRRVAILDFDLHYGNGTADIFKGDPSVWLLSTYQTPLYPFWPGEPEARNLVDAALPPHAGSAEFRAAVTQHWQPALERLQPEMILVSAGFDAHADDPLGDLRLDADDYRWIGTWIRDIAARFCGGRVVATLEGGYALGALAGSVEAFLRPFLEPGRR